MLRAPWSAAAFALGVMSCSKGEEPVAASKATPTDPSASASASTAVSTSGDTADAPEPLPPQPTPVNLAGDNLPVAVSVVAKGPRIYSRALRTWVFAQPSLKARKLGYLRSGASSPTTAEPAGTDGCKGGWYPVEPRGYVCNGRRATLDANDPLVRATEEYRPDFHRKLPYVYGTVRRTGPVYARLPTGDELRSTERGIDERMDDWLSAEGEVGASYAQHVWMGGLGDAPDPAQAWKDKASDPLPWFLENGQSAPSFRRGGRDGNPLTIGSTERRVGYAFYETFLHEGRRYGVTTDLVVLPTDRLRPIQGSDFHGYEIGKDVDFPFAIVRQPTAKLWQKSGGGLVDAGTAPYRGAVRLTGKQQFFSKVLHYETQDGKWLSDRDASRLDPAKRMPAWGKNGEKWIDVNLTKQTVVLYEGTKPVYATLVSSGEAGLEDPKHTTATKRGIFRVHTKHVTATMSSDEAGEEFELRDVPYVQYFDGEGFALHGAYWHDRFGIPKSHGCINLSPEDARRIFFWTEPQVPVGWHGALLPLKGTVLFVHP